mmetsp:Transcript_43186/g.104546  ORF Transcript_43186/g.104546 Transcript_43186/m.104546 type:complete len:626 (+) Transcript_43186:132-2009(+)
MAMMVVVPSSAVKTMIISTKMIVVVMTTMMMMMITTMASYPVLAAATPMGERAAAATAATAAASTDRTSSSSSVTTSGGATATVVVVERETVKIDYSELQEVFGHGNDNDDGDKDDGDGDGDARRTLLLSLQKRIFDAFGSSSSSSGSGSSTATTTAMSDSEEPSKETTIRPNQQPMEPLGLLEVTNVPTRIQQLRQQVLGRHAVDLAHLPKEELSKLEFPETMYTTGWSHGKEKLKKKKKKKKSSSSPKSRTSSDGREEEEEGRDQEQKHIVDDDKMAYDTTKGSFYFDPYGDDDESTRTTKTIFPEVLQPQFEHDLIEMTRFMTQVGLWIAKLCDMTLLVVQQHRKGSIDNNESPSMIYDSLQSGRAAKARLLYYYPMKNSSSSISRSTTSNGDGGYDSTGAVATTRNEDVDDDVDDDDEEEEFDTWCGWHKDHSSLTVLLPGLMHEYEKENDNDGDDSNIDRGHQSILQHNKRMHKPGLYIQIRDRQQQKYSGDNIDSSRRGPPTELVHVALQETSLGFQIGETIEIMSRGTLHATPHAVKAPAPPLSSDTERSSGRASLAVFLQPLPDTLLPPLPLKDNDTCTSRSDAVDDGDVVDAMSSLKQRWRPTFGEFQKATTEAFN